MSTTIGSYYSLDDCTLSWMDCSNPSRTTDCQQRLTNYTKSKFCIKLVFFTQAESCLTDAK